MRESRFIKTTKTILLKQKEEKPIKEQIFKKPKDITQIKLPQKIAENKSRWSCCFLGSFSFLSFPKKWNGMDPKNLESLMEVF